MTSLRWYLKAVTASSSGGSPSITTQKTGFHSPLCAKCREDLENPLAGSLAWSHKRSGTIFFGGPHLWPKEKKTFPSKNACPRHGVRCFGTTSPGLFWYGRYTWCCAPHQNTHVLLPPRAMCAVVFCGQTNLGVTTITSSKRGCD